MDKFIALVPMKAHSTRVKNKNIKSMVGHPLFYYILETLERCNYISEIYINTDSDKIKDLLHKDFRHVNIISRPKHLIGNSVPMNDIINYDLSQIDGEYFLQTHSTNPLLSHSTIEKAIKFFLSHKEYDSLFSVTKLLKRFYDSNGNPITHDPNKLINTQDLPPLFEENSCIYLFTRKSFKSNNRIGKNPHMFEIDRMESIDIDDEFDFRLVENIMCMKKN